MRVGLLIVGLIAVSACNRSPEASAAGTNGGGAVVHDKAPEVVVFEQLRSGIYQLDVATDAMERATNRLRPFAAGKPEETRGALQAVVDYLDSAAGTVVELNDVPTQEEVRADFKTFDERRLQAIEEAEDARRDVEQAASVMDDLLASNPPADAKATLQEIDDLLEEAIDALEGSIEAFGGKVRAGSGAG